MPEPLTKEEFELFAQRLVGMLEQKIKDAAQESAYGALPVYCKLRDQWQHLWFGGTPGHVSLRKALFPEPRSRSPFGRPPTHLTTPTRTRTKTREKAPFSKPMLQGIHIRLYPSPRALCGTRRGLSVVRTLTRRGFTFLKLTKDEATRYRWCKRCLAEASKAKWRRG